MPNNYTPNKLYTLGHWIKNGNEEVGNPPYSGTWPNLLGDKEFSEWRKHHEVTDEQLRLIKRGFHGWPVEGLNCNPAEKINVNEIDGDSIISFGTHKGKPFKKIPDDYFLFLLQQTWIDKWPNVKLYAKRIKDRIKDGAATSEEIK